jgi:hypothetical protein
MKLEHQHQQHEAGTSTSTTHEAGNININNTKLEQTSTTWNINNTHEAEHININNMNHQQHEAGTSTSICGNRMRQVHQQQHLWYSDRPSLPDLGICPGIIRFPRI